MANNRANLVQNRANSVQNRTNLVLDGVFYLRVNALASRRALQGVRILKNDDFFTSFVIFTSFFLS